jgi:hypothetical protein
MIGTHPKTGKPIRILQTETSIHRNQKTIAWFSTPVSDSKWCRYDIGVFGSANINEYTDIVVLADSQTQEEDAKWILNGNTNTVKIIFASKDLLNVIGFDTLKEMKIGNMICLDEILEMYPFVGEPWDGTKNDAALLASLLLREHTALGLDTKTNRAIQVAELVPPKELWMISQYYIPSRAKRAREVAHCLKKNIECSMIDKVVLLNEEYLSSKFPTQSNKIHQEIVGHRLTYADVILWIQKNVPENVIVVFANSDIYLDDSWRILWSVDLRDKFLSLLRYDLPESGEESESKLFGPRPDSQDTWVVLSDSVKSRSWDSKALDFTFGRAGCDNAINVEMLRAKFLVANPSLSLKTYHVHSSEIRNYDPQDIVDKPIYFYIHPTGIHDMNPLTTLPSEWCIEKLIGTPFSRKVISKDAKQARTYCTMLKRDNKYLFSYGDANLFTPSSIPIYKVDNAFQTSSGLGYSYSSLFVGNSKKASEMWSRSNMTTLAPSLALNVGLIVPLSDEAIKNPEAYMIQYLSNILLLREKAGGQGEFWSPRERQFLDVLQLFQWGRKEVPVLPRDEQIQVWCKTAYMMLPRDDDFITAEQVSVLRRFMRLGGWLETRDEEKNRCILFADEKVLTHSFINEYEDAHPDRQIEVIYPGRTNSETIAIKMRGASTVICSSSIQCWAWLWLLPRGAEVLEIQNEMEPNGDCLHMASACGLSHRLIIAPKGTISATVQKQLIENLSWSPEPIKSLSNLPVLYMPTPPSSSFFSHAGDSFREMARLWEQKGYIRIVEDKTLNQIWLNGIGNVLLYDRPTYEWLERAPIEERKWKLALFGNPAPRGENSKSWSFWPRRPELVEKLVREGIANKSFQERPQRLVLYGKVENAVQKERRSGALWAAACSEFKMPVGAEKTYPFTQEEYLIKLSESRFGLCLPGYGWKCHREVECMAMGCVPIVSSEVDMKNYANPPVANLHYFVAETPEQAQKLSLETSEEKWSEMSAACKKWWNENVSCDGMWNLTKSLLTPT